MAKTQTNLEGGEKPFNWGALGSQGFPDQLKVSSTPVRCNDGTTQNQQSSPNGKYMSACTNHGGVSPNQPLGNAIPIEKETATQQQPESDLQYYTSANFLKRASISIIPVGLIGYYCYNKKFSLLKSALLVSIPIVAITIMQNIGFGGGKNAYWGIFIPPSIKSNSMKQIQLEPKQIKK
jgi:hypothetical protein